MRPRPRGHNLLEMILACFLFLVASMGLCGVWMQHSKAMGLASCRLMAQHLGQATMEDCIGAQYANVDRLVGQTTIGMNEVIRDKPISSSYVLNVTVTNDVVQNWKVVRVLVKWHDQLGDSQLQYKTLLAKPTP